MALKISSSGLFKRSFLVLKKDGFKFYETGMFWGAKRYRFREVSTVMMGADHSLSFQVGLEVHSIETEPHNPKHQAVIAELLAGLEASRSSGQSSVHLPL
jgi:hypothetical protein